MRVQELSHGQLTGCRQIYQFTVTVEEQLAGFRSQFGSHSEVANDYELTIAEVAQAVLYERAA